MLYASGVFVSSSVVCTMWPYACVRAMSNVCGMPSGFQRVSAFELAIMYTFRLYFWGCVPVVVCVCVVV